MMLQRMALALEPRLFLLTIVSAWVIVALAGWFYLLKPGLKNYKALQQERNSVQLSIADAAELRSQLAAVQATLQQLQKTKADQVANSGAVQLGTLVSELAALASQHNLRLLSVTPGRSDQMSDVHVTPYQVELAGSFSGSFAFLDSLASAPLSLVTQSLELKAAGSADQIQVRLELVAFHQGKERLS